MKRVALLLAVVAIIFTLPSCSKPKKNRAIRIAINVWPGYAHAFIAEERGFFKKNGVKVELILKKDTTESRRLYERGDVDGVFTIVPDVVILNSKGIETKIVYVADYSDTGDVIVGRSEYSSLSDLKDKTVSFEGLNTFSHMFVLKVLERADVKESEVRFANIPASDVLAALEEGRIDAGHTWEPVKSQALEKGYKILAKAGDIPGVITDVLAFNSKIIEQRPEDIKAIVKSVLEARDFVHTNRDEALAIMSKAEGIGKKELAVGIGGVYQPDLKENIEAMKPSKEMTSLYRSGELVVKFYSQRGQMSKVPDLDEMVEARFVNELARE